MARAPKPKSKKPATGYDSVKEFEGKRYTGMKIGRWKISEIKNQGLVNAIGNQIADWYKQAA